MSVRYDSFDVGGERDREEEEGEGESHGDADGERGGPNPGVDPGPAPSANGADGFVPNEDVGAAPSLRFVAAPSDKGVLEDYQNDPFPGPCFACIYGSGRKESSAWNAQDISDAYEDMIKLMRENYGNMTENDNLVNMIYEYYEREIRSIHDYGEWKKSCIYQHIFCHQCDEDVQMQETTSMLFSQIQSLRTKTWVMNEDTGTTEPHLKNLYLLERLVKSYDDHVAKRRARLAKLTANA